MKTIIARYVGEEESIRVFHSIKQPTTLTLSRTNYYILRLTFALQGGIGCDISEDQGRIIYKDAESFLNDWTDITTDPISDIKATRRIFNEK